MQWYKNLIVSSLIILSSVASIAQAQEYKIVLDQDASPYEGASLLQSTFNFYKYLDDRILPSSKGKKQLYWDAARLGHIGIDYALSSFFMIIEHEVFGHGYRAREFDFAAIGYKLYIQRGATYFYLFDYNALNTYQQNALNAAGMEANTILSQQIRQPWFFGNNIDHRDAMFYIINQIGQFRYVYRTSGSDINSGNDINNYIRGVNTYYNSNVLSNPKMRAYILADLLDPNLYYSVYSLGMYLIQGTPAVPMYMFNINNYKYLPTVRTILAPYGLEFQLQNFVKTPKDQLWQVNLRGGSNSSIGTIGLDVNVTPIWSYRKFDFANYFSCWYQPKMIYANAAVAKSRLGFAEFVSMQYNCTKKFGLLLDLGYKTTGFMQGFLLSNAVIVRCGCRW